MKKTFQLVPVDADTKILSQEEIKINQLDALYQKWDWEGTIGHSIIFHDSDVSELSDDEIIQQIKSSGNEQLKVLGRTTISRKGIGFTFVNFGFELS
jgi:hypothetical protein